MRFRRFEHELGGVGDGGLRPAFQYELIFSIAEEQAVYGTSLFIDATVPAKTLQGGIIP